MGRLLQCNFIYLLVFGGYIDILSVSTVCNSESCYVRADTSILVLGLET